VAVALEKLKESAPNVGGTHMRAIYECADDSPTRRLRLDLLAKRVHDRLDLVGIEAAAREKCVQPPPSSEVVKSSERLPFLFRHSTHGCLGIHAVTVTNFVECLVRELAGDSTSRELLHDAATRRASREKLGAGELSGEISVVQILLLL